MSLNPTTAAPLGLHVAWPWALLATVGISPWGAQVFESSMPMHMLVQLPLLALAGVALLLLPALRRWLHRQDPKAYLALVVGSASMLYWMLPVSLDWATIDPLQRAFKLWHVPLGVGVSLGWVWLRASTLLKTLLCFEVWASITRVAWLFLESPAQLCSSYLIGEQLLVGELLMLLSVAGGGYGLCYFLFGSFGGSESRG